MTNQDVLSITDFNALSDEERKEAIKTVVKGYYNWTITHSKTIELLGKLYESKKEP